MNKFSEPYEHYVVDSFLDDVSFKKITQLYSSLQFKELKTDLFNFLQSNEIKDDVKFFTDKLCKVLEENKIFEDKKIDINESNFTMFASYYRKNDFLLCHDDCVDNREYAFTYYLEDVDGGDLVIYEKDCITENKRVQVKTNRLAFFRVSSDSWHEVAKATNEGRKAITGWLVSKNRKLSHRDFHNILSVPGKTNEVDSSSVTNAELPLSIDSDAFQKIDLSGYGENIVKEEISGPFVDRRATKLIVEEPIVFDVPGLSTIHYDFLRFGDTDYILCNDKINDINGEIYDGFLFRSNGDDFIHYINPKTNTVEFSHKTEKDVFVFGKRRNLKLFVSSPKKPVEFYHFIYRKE